MCKFGEWLGNDASLKIYEGGHSGYAKWGLG